MILETQRLILRPVTREDAEDMFEYASDVRVTSMTRFEPHRTLEDSRQAIETVFLTRVERGWPAAFALVDKKTNKMIGTCDFWPVSNVEKTFEMGYALNPEYWGQGLMTEAGRAVIHYAFRSYGVDRLELKHVKENKLSQSVALKLGFTQEGIKRQAAKTVYGMDDLVIYGFLKEEYHD